LDVLYVIIFKLPDKKCYIFAAGVAEKQQHLHVYLILYLLAADVLSVSVCYIKKNG